MRENGISVLMTVVISVIVTAVIVGSTVYMAVPREVENEEPVSKKLVIGCEWEGPVEGTTWVGRIQYSIDQLEIKYPFLTTSVQEGVGPDLTPTLAEEMIEQGANIIIASTEWMGVPLADITAKYPEVYFLCQTNGGNWGTGKNWIRYFLKQWQPAYLAGIVAGALTETNNIGVVGAMFERYVTTRLNAFTLGVQEVNPDATVYMIYVGGWYDPPKEREVALTLVDEYNCDVLTQQSDSSSAVTVAKEKGIWFIGKDHDPIQLGWADETTVAISFINNWHVVWDKVIKDFLADEPYPKNMYISGYDDYLLTEEGPIYTCDIVLGDKVGADAISPYAKEIIGSEVVELVREKREQLIAGWDPFLKEIIDTEGQLRSPDGEMPPVDELIKEMDYFVKGTVVPVA